jgi:hypothetical protein
VVLQYLYIDESGDPGDPEKGSQFLVIAAVLVANPAELDRIIKHMRRNKFKKQLHKAQEIKANKSKEEIITYMLCQLNKITGVQLFVIVLEKRKLYSEYLKNHKHKLYNYVAGKLTENDTLRNTDLEIRVDKSKGKVLQQDFNQYFEKKLSETPNRHRVEIYHSYSESWSGLQFADVVARSFFQKFEHHDNTFVDVLTIRPDVKFMF